ncbi:hypothetical protein VNO77_01493 [Canavalia gladiata]|uniref:Uncharacterized protein n=1 Tax=Canavalia gladiata TaxID=3824 RepID=A0AAN9MRY7_CANGL
MNEGEKERKYWDWRDKRGYGFWVTINDLDSLRKISLVGSDMSVGPRRAIDDNLLLLLLLLLPYLHQKPHSFGTLLIANTLSKGPQEISGFYIDVYGSAENNSLRHTKVIPFYAP